MGEEAVLKKYNNGAWTQGRFDAFIKGIIRDGLKRWGPKHDCIKQARTKRGFYQCGVCKEEVPATILRELKTKPGTMKRVRNIYADHILPIVDPTVGRRSWDEVIERAFVDTIGYQAICYGCHETKTQAEKMLSRERIKRDSELENNNE